MGSAVIVWIKFHCTALTVALFDKKAMPFYSLIVVNLRVARSYKKVKSLGFAVSDTEVKFDICQEHSDWFQGKHLPIICFPRVSNSWCCTRRNAVQKGVNSSCPCVSYPHVVLRAHYCSTPENRMLSCVITTKSGAFCLCVITSW